MPLSKKDKKKLEKVGTRMSQPSCWKCGFPLRNLKIDGNKRSGECIICEFRMSY